MPGDNIVWQVDAIAIKALVTPYAKAAGAGRLIYSFRLHEQLIPDDFAEIHTPNPVLGFES